MNEAIRQAIEALSFGNLPFGAALLDENFDLIHSAHNKTRQFKNNNYHAEIVLFEELKNKNIDFSKTTLVTTTEPCLHCYNTAYELGIRTFIFGSTIYTSREYFPTDEMISIENLDDDTIVMQENSLECDSLFALYEDKHSFIPNVFLAKGSLTELYWMEVTLKVAEQAMIEYNEIPVGVILVEELGINNERLLTESPTLTYNTNSPIMHGDIAALLLAERYTYEHNTAVTMYSTLEPHLLGFGAAMKAHLRKVVYGLEAFPDGGSAFFKNETTSLEHPPFIVGGILKERQYELFKQFLEREKDNQSRVGYDYVKGMINYYEKVYLNDDK